jgi:hypothetical protein
MLKSHVPDFKLWTGIYTYAISAVTSRAWEWENKNIHMLFPL